MSGFVVAAGWKLLWAFSLFAAMLCLLSAAELAFPREEIVSWRRRWNFIRFAALFMVANVIFAMLVSYPMRGMRIPGLPGFLLALFVTDFFYYWYHRAQHRFAWLWRFHSVHHSVEKMGAGAGYHHLLEIPFKALFVSLPLAFVIDTSAGAAAAVIFSLHGPYLHSTTRLNFGPFAWIVADNRTHRIHHSLTHENRNFGAFTMLWDRIFRTDHFPASDEWPEIGVKGQPEPQSVAGYVRLPRLPREDIDRSAADRPAGMVIDANGVDVVRAADIEY